MSEIWNVSFNDGYFENHSKKRSGIEQKINYKFNWGEYTVHIPSVYICTKGLVTDVLFEIDKDKVWNFIRKFDLINNEFAEQLTKDQRSDLERENPLNHSYNSVIKVNKKLINSFRSSACAWIPDLPEDKNPSKEAEEVLEYYEKSKDKAWSIHRFQYEWETVRKPKITSLEISFSQNKQSFPSEHFKNPRNGDEIEITNPINGQKYQLKILDSEKRILDDFHNVSPELEIPKNFSVMRYTVKPEPGIGDFHVEDVIEPDIPHKIEHHNIKETVSQNHEAAAIGIIGGIDGPIAIVAASTPQYRTATSSLHFNTDYDVEWRAVFLAKQIEDISVKLI